MLFKDNKVALKHMW